MDTQRSMPRIVANLPASKGAYLNIGKLPAMHSMTLAVIAGIVVVAALGIVIYFGYWASWTGFNENIPPAGILLAAYRPPRRLWEWMELLIVPLVLATGVYFLNRTERNNAQRAAEQRAETERKIADDRLQESVIETYLDRMSELLLEKGLASQQSGGAVVVRDVARTRTLTALRRLEGGRKGTLLRFLYESGLLRVGEPIVALGGADLEHVSLASVDLAQVNLAATNLSYADLQQADIRAGNLQQANLQQANLQLTDLRGANLYGVDLQNANLQGANLGGADLRQANLQKANLRYANLQGANLESANLRYARLQQTDLQGANLQGAIIVDTMLEKQSDTP